MRSTPLWFAAVGLAGCGERYVYRPQEKVAAVVDGRAAARYEVPPESPRGVVRVASFGISEVRTDGGGASPALHVRMVVVNNSEATWTVDTREQRAILPDQGESRPAAASTADGAPPVLTVPPRQQRVLDLFYPLPPTYQEERRLPEFDLAWQVDTGARVVAERTPFARLSIEPRRVADAYAFPYDPLWGPVWWYDPLYPRYAFRGFVGVPLHPGPWIVVERPRWPRPPVARPPVARPPEPPPTRMARPPKVAPKVN